MEKKQVAEILEEIGTLLDLKGENPFKCRAYHNASRIVAAITADLATLIESGKLSEVKGIGAGLAEKITELVKTGHLKYYEDLKKSLPSGLFDMLNIQGLGPKRVKILYDKLKIKSIDSLKEAAEKGKLAKLEGFGGKTQENILQGIEALKRHADKFLFPAAWDAAEAVHSVIRQQKWVVRSEVAGSLRRKNEVIGDIDILVSTRPTEAKKTMKLFTSHPEVERVLAEGETKSSVILKAGINCDLRVVSDRQFPFALHYFTGSKQHNIRMRSIAKDMDIKMNEYGLFKGKAEKFISCSDEEEIFETLGLVYVPPELREDMGEIEAAQKTKLPKLLEATDIRGTFHCHTSYSDGSNSVEEMSKAARDLGWEYLGIADHSKIAAYAGGLSVERVKQQHREIDRLNKRHSNFRIFKGTEVDILTDGSLDWSDTVLAMFDYVVASIHSKFKMSEAEATKRIIKAIKNDFVTMLGHPTGRLLLSRDGYPVNMVDVINAASDYGKIIEINAHPLRLDLDWRLCKYAKEKGVRVLINPDAHDIEGLRDVLYGVGIARKGWLEKRDVVNTRNLREVVKLLKLNN